MGSSYFLQFIGGLSFFFFGLYAIHQSLQSYAGERLKSMITRTTQSRFKSLLTGLLATLFFQSSSAVTTMSVGLTSSGLLTLTQAMAIALGSGIGTTFVVLIISIKSIMEYGIAILVIGMIMKFFGYRKKTKILGEVLFGFGFVFFGLNMMSLATAPLQSYSYIPQIFDFIENYPFWNFLLSALVTALVHSSGVLLGVIISLSHADTISLNVALPIILGANVGTSFTAILASLNAKADGKRAAWANLLLRTGAVALLFPFLNHINTGLHSFNDYFCQIFFNHNISVAAEIALIHFYFNLFVALFFLPLLPYGQKLICSLIPARNEVQDTFGPKYLDDSALITPSLAFAQINREVLRMGEIVQSMFHDIIGLFITYDLDLIESIESRDHKVDTLYRAIKFYLAKISLQNMKGKEVNYSIHIMTAINELENIGDTIDKHLIRLIHKKWNKGYAFSDEGWLEIKEMHKGTAHMLELTMAVLASANEELVIKMRHYQKIYADREGQIKISHLKRLNQGLKESLETSSVHLELQAIFYRINLSLLTIVNHLMPENQIPEETYTQDLNHSE